MSTKKVCYLDSEVFSSRSFRERSIVVRIRKQNSLLIVLFDPFKFQHLSQLLAIFLNCSCNARHFESKSQPSIRSLGKDISCKSRFSFLRPKTQETKCRDDRTY